MFRRNSGVRSGTKSNLYAAMNGKTLREWIRSSIRSAPSVEIRKKRIPRMCQSRRSDSHKKLISHSKNNGSPYRAASFKLGYSRMAFKRSAVRSRLSPPKRPEIVRFQVFFRLKSAILSILLHLFKKSRNTCFPRNFTYQSSYQNYDGTLWTGRHIIPHWGI